MGTYSILVIGNDWRSAIGPSIDFDSNPRLKYEDIFEESLNRFKDYQSNRSEVDSSTFLEWLRKTYRRPIITRDTRTFYHDYKGGWIRIDEKQEVTEVIWRDRPESYITGEIAQFPLKPGCKGWETNPYDDTDIEVLEGYVNSARICDIDWDKMSEQDPKKLFYVDCLDVYRRGELVASHPDTANLIKTLDVKERLTSLIVRH